MQTPPKPQLTTIRFNDRTEKKDRTERKLDRTERPDRSVRADRTIGNVADKTLAKTPFQTGCYQALREFKSCLPTDRSVKADRSAGNVIAVDRTLAKTPFQIGSNYAQRDYKSELPANRVARPRLQPQSSQRYVLSRLASIYSKSTSYKDHDTHQHHHSNNTHQPETKQTPQISRAQSESSIKYQVRVNDKTYKVLRKIGSGGSAKVYEGFEPHTLQPVAIKIINVAAADPRAREGYFNEKALLLRLQDCEHVVRMFDSEYKEHCKELVIVMEKGEADLSQVIDTHFKQRSPGMAKTIDGIFIKFYWRGMLLAVNDIHSRGIVHADLKPVNFILVKNEIKLIDFGIATAIDPEGTSVIRDYQIGTVNYMAPEALRNRATDASFIHDAPRMTTTTNENQKQDEKKRLVIKYNSKVDIWSLGCILYNLVYGKPPFDEFKDIVSKLHAITNPRHVIKFPELSNQHLLRCMRACLRYNPTDRPTVQQLLEDPYIKGDVLTINELISI